VAPADRDDVAFDALTRFLPLAHRPSVAQNEITALDLSVTSCHTE
jgi:hypothetical protein